MTNTLYYGDNLPILRTYFPAASVDLIYLDPPFNSNRSYNVLFKDESGRDSEAQITAFEDSWHWGRSTEDLYHELLKDAPDRIARVLAALIESLGRTNQICAYLVMMAARLIELHRVLKPTGSIYLHCDPTASHYLKLVLDVIFGEWNFRNEIVWKRTSSHNLGAKQWPALHDIILMYSCDSDWCWNIPYSDYDDEYKRKNFPYKDERGNYASYDITGGKAGGAEAYQPWRGRNPGEGRAWALPSYKRLPGWLQELLPSEEEWQRLGIHSKLNLLDEHKMIHWPKKEGGQPRFKHYLKDAPGEITGDNWNDIPPIAARSQERLGYPTQKPRALLERIIKASSNPGDLVLDPFCGCGTAIDAAHHLGRRWAGIDITHLSVALMKYRLRDRYDLRPGRDYEVIGEPTTLSGAQQLASDDRYQFQWWALSLVSAKPLGAPKDSRSGKKGADRGIDGVINFLGDGGKAERALIQVKSGGVNSADIRDLRGTLEREKAAIAAFITLESPSKPMQTEALAAGFYETEAWGNFPRLQLLTVEDLLSGDQQLEMPREYGTFRRAPRAKRPAADQKKMRLG